MITREIENFTHGLVDNLEKKSIPVGSAAAMLNFRTRGDKVELRRGQLILGTDAGAGGSVDGIHVAYKADGTAVAYKKIGRKLLYYDTVTEDWIEVGTDLFPALAEDDEASFANYQSQAGAIMFVSSKNSSVYKIMVANPGSYSDLAQTVYRGKIIIHKNRTMLWDRKSTTGEQDTTGVNLSWIDNEKYTAVSAEAVGASGATSYTYTLAFKAGGSKRTCFGMAIKIGGTIKLVDDYNGNLTHVDGASNGSGTINYTSGAVTITLTVAAGGALTADYQWEDSTDEGVFDFDYSATRVAGEGDLLRQDDGGQMQNAFVFNDQYFCFHERTIYKLVLSVDDTDAENNVFRNNAGIPNWRAAVPTGDGVYYLDNATEAEPVVRLLTLDQGSTEVLPVAISRQLNLKNYYFDQCWMIKQGDLILIGCRTLASTYNNRVLVYDELFKTWDVIDYEAKCASLYNGTLILGDSITNNVYVGFSGVDDDESEILGQWESNQWDLEYPSHLKKSKRLMIEGEIGPNQIIDVSAAPDDGGYILIGQIRGDGSYIDSRQSVNVGANTLGQGEIGGGSDGISAFHYFHEMSFSTVGKFLKLQIKFSVGSDATTNNIGIGYFSFSKIRFDDVRVKTQKIPSKYRG